MAVSHTKNSTRIIIWVIAIVMALGFLGSYFLVILENENANKQNTEDTDLSAQQDDTTGQVDPTAYRVDGAVEKLEITDHKIGDGPEAKEGDVIRVHYKGTVAASGVKFDSSYDRGEPVEFPLQRATESQQGVIDGWVEGLKGMKVGGSRRLVIPAAMAYGEQTQGSIPANAALVFEVELLGVTPATQ